MGEERKESLLGKVLLGKLEVLRVLGEGGMGAVYEVEHRITRHHRALKVLHPGIAQDAEVVTRFLREASVAGTLNSPFVVETFDAGQLDDGSPYVLMEMLEGETLDDAMKGGALTRSRFLSLVGEACKGLAAAHDAGIVHRDLKPENIFVAKTHDGERVKLLDFGISKFSSRDEDEVRLTRTGRVMGTPLYMSPEQASGSSELDARTDIYSLGVILYEGLAGRPPFLADTLPALVIQIHTGDYRSLIDVVPSIDRDLAAVVHKAMSRRPDDRYATITEFERALVGLADRTKDHVSFAETAWGGEDAALAGTMASMPPGDGRAAVAGGSKSAGEEHGAAFPATALGPTAPAMASTAMASTGPRPDEATPPPAEAADAKVPAGPPALDDDGASSPGSRSLIAGLGLAGLGLAAVGAVLAFSGSGDAPAVEQVPSVALSPPPPEAEAPAPEPEDSSPAEREALPPGRDLPVQAETPLPAELDDTRPPPEVPAEGEPARAEGDRRGRPPRARRDSSGDRPAGTNSDDHPTPPRGDLPQIDRNLEL